MLDNYSNMDNTRHNKTKSPQQGEARGGSLRDINPKTQEP